MNGQMDMGTECGTNKATIYYIEHTA